MEEKKNKTTGSNMAPSLESRTLVHEQLHQPSQVVHSCNGRSMSTVSSSCLMCLDTSPLGSKIPLLPVICGKHFGEML